MASDADQRVDLPSAISAGRECSEGVLPRGEGLGELPEVVVYVAHVQARGGDEPLGTDGLRLLVRLFEHAQGTAAVAQVLIDQADGRQR